MVSISIVIIVCLFIGYIIFLATSPSNTAGCGICSSPSTPIIPIFIPPIIPSNPPTTPTIPPTTPTIPSTPPPYTPPPLDIPGPPAVPPTIPTPPEEVPEPQCTPRPAEPEPTSGMCNDSNQVNMGDYIDIISPHNKYTPIDKNDYSNVTMYGRYSYTPSDYNSSVVY